MKIEKGYIVSENFDKLLNYDYARRTNGAEMPRNGVSDEKASKDIPEDKTPKNDNKTQNNAMYDYSAKQDCGKMRLSIVPKAIISDISAVREYGIKKYTDVDNWRSVEIVRYQDALFRHYLAFCEDPFSKDDESGLYHYQHLACNVAFICEMMKEAVKVRDIYINEFGSENR